MPAAKYLTLQSIRLKPAEEWSHVGLGLCFIFPRQGTGVLTGGDPQERLQPGDLLTVHGESTGRLRASEQNELTFQCFAANLEHLIPLLGPRELSFLQNVIDSFKRPRRYAAAGGVAQECHRLLAGLPLHSTLSHRSGLLSVAACILAEEFSRASSQRVGFVRSDEHMSEVFEKLSIEELLDLSVPELAKKFSCSRRHLNRLFHQHFGISVTALKMEMRLLKAIALLADPGAKILGVAEECGFHHLGLFNTCFKRRFGATPSEYRRNGGQHDAAPQLAVQNHGSCSMSKSGLCPWQDGSARQPGLSAAAAALPTKGIRVPASVPPDGKNRPNGAAVKQGTYTHVQIPPA